MSSASSGSGGSGESGKRKKSKSKSEDKSRIYDPTIFQVRLVDKVYEPHHEIAADLRHSTPQAILRDLARPEKKFMINPHEWETVEVPIDGGRSETRGLRQMRYANYRIALWEIETSGPMRKAAWAEVRAAIDAPWADAPRFGSQKDPLWRTFG